MLVLPPFSPPAQLHPTLPYPPSSVHLSRVQLGKCQSSSPRLKSPSRQHNLGEASERPLSFKAGSCSCVGSQCAGSEQVRDAVAILRYSVALWHTAVSIPHLGTGEQHVAQRLSSLCFFCKTQEKMVY